MTLLKKLIKHIFLLLCIIGTQAIESIAQVETENPEREFIYKGNHFLPGSPWLNVGGGVGYNFSEEMYEPNFYIDMHYQFKKKKQCLGFGYLSSRDQFFDTQNGGLFLPHSYVRHSVNNLHITYGLRLEKMHHNFALMIGPSFNWGYRHAYTDSLGNDYHEDYREIGLYASLQYSYKIFYDIGVGTSLWTSIGSSYKVVGLSMHIYLSSAFKRKL